MESAEVATGGGMQRQGGILAPGWPLLQAIAGVHLTNAQTGSPGGPSPRGRGIQGYFGTSTHAIHSTVVRPSSIRSLLPIRTRLYHSTYLPPACLLPACPPSRFPTEVVCG